jgi:DNA-directed RNA polymerase subunit RPC12/RpoP
MLAKEEVVLLVLFGLSIAAILLRVAARRARHIKCPYCGWLQVRRTWRKGLREWFLKRLFVLPYRCMACQNRFLRFGVNFRHYDQKVNDPANTQVGAPTRLSPK